MKTVELESLIKDCCIAEIDYYNAKEKREHVEADANLTVDWKKINTEREAEGLSKITNETQRKSYIKILVEDFKHNENCKLVEWNRLKMIYENKDQLSYQQKVENQNSKEE